MLRLLFSFIARALAQFRPPPRRQVAALCWRDGEILLVTTRRTGRWTPPKGWPMKKKTLAGAAATEAWEEAGVIGEIGENPIGSYIYTKRSRDGGIGQPVEVAVFPLHVDRLADDYPETGQRERRWMTPASAADAVQEPALKRLIANFPA